MTDLATHAADHVLWSELHCWNRTGRLFNGVPPGGLVAIYPLDWRDDRLQVWLREFAIVRGWWGLPLVFGSFFRTPDYNAHIGGVVNSEHCQGRAGDVYPPRGVGNRDFYDRIRRYACDPRSGSKIRGVGWYDWGVHMDVRPSSVVRLWRAARPGAEQSQPMDVETVGKD